jgi:peptide/nickel transport system substrate-binding protein
VPDEFAYEALINLDQNNKMTPGIAQSWKVGSYQKRPNKTITFELRHNARFSDGEPVTAAAVKNYIDYRATKSTQFDGDVGGLREVDVLGKYTVKVIVKTPNPDLPLAFGTADDWGSIASPKSIAAEKADPKSDYLATHTAGAGPYYVDNAQTVTNDHCTMLPNPYYYDKSKIHWGKVIVKAISDSNAVLAAMQTGQVDVALSADPKTAPAAQRAGLKVVPDGGPVVGFLILDHKGVVSKPFGDPRVRQALNYAIDRATIAHGLEGPLARPTSNEDQPRLLPKKWDQYYSYNPAKAKQLLAAAGYPNGFTFNIFVRGPYVGPAYDQSPEAAAVAKNLAAIGVTMKINITNNTDDLLNALNGKTYPAWLVTIGLNSTWQYYSALLAPNIFLGDQHGWHDPVIDKLFYKAIVAPRQKAEDLWNQLDIRAIQQADFIPLYRQPHGSFVDKRVGGVIGGTNAYTPSNPITWYPTGK